MATKRRPVVAATSISSGKDELSSIRDIEFRKANDSIGLRVQEGKFTYLGRKLYNVFISKAQKMGRPGQNSPVNTLANESYFWFPMSEVAKDASYGSKDSEIFKQTVQSLLDIRVIAESDTEWTSERLLSGVKMVNTKGLKNKGGTVWIGIAFPPEVLQMVLRPSVYTRFSLVYQTLLRSASSLALYEITRRYADSPSHVTRKEPWEWWYASITGNPVTEAIPEYKYFKRDTLQKVIAEINAVTDIEIELVEFKKVRRVEFLQFRVARKQQQSLELPSPPLIDASIIERIMRFGISQEDASNLYAAFDEETVLAHIELVEARMKSKKGSTIESPAAYFRTALKNGYANGARVAKPAPVKPEVQSRPKKGLRERYIAARSHEALRYFDELESMEQQELVDLFTAQIDKAHKPFLKKGLESPVVRSLLGEWLATHMWGEPDDTAVLEYLERETVI